jgi:hypothetical protein
VKNASRVQAAVMVFAIAVNVGAASISRWPWWLFNVASVVFLLAAWRWSHRQRRELARQHLITMSMLAPCPEGVEVVRANGDRVACELIYAGAEDDTGNHLWTVAGMVLDVGDSLQVQVWPPHTGITVARRLDA